MRNIKFGKKTTGANLASKVFPDTHPAIISREDFALVQELRSHRRRPAKTGIVSMFSGLLYCADCGQKLYYSATGNDKREQANFFCSSYRKDSEHCPSHFIREKVVSELVLKRMQQTFLFVQMFERRFAQRQMASTCRNSGADFPHTDDEKNQPQNSDLEF